MPRIKDLKIPKDQNPCIIDQIQKHAFRKEWPAFPCNIMQASFWMVSIFNSSLKLPNKQLISKFLIYMAFLAEREGKKKKRKECSEGGQKRRGELESITK